jgi:hypothetical protein
MSTSITQETNEFPQTIEGVHLVTSTDPCFGFDVAIKKAREGYKIVSKLFSPIYYFKYVESGALDIYTKKDRIYVTRLTAIDTKMFAYTDYSTFD